MEIKIYYLDDEPALLSLFKDLFESDEVKVKTYVQVEVALDEIKKNPPDILFLDYRLPNTTAEDIVPRLSPSLPKAIITGELNVSMKSNIDAVFEKPFDVPKIEQFIQNYVNKGVNI